MTRTLLLAAALASLAGCSTTQLKAEYAETTDFRKYRSWAWSLAAPANSEEPRVRDPAVHALIKKTVERELSARGLAQVALADGPDALVDFFGWAQDRTDTKQASSGVRGSGYTYDPGASSRAVTEVRTLRDGTIIIDVFDASTRARVWRGTASDSVVAGAGPGAVEAAVVEILAKFPPGSR